MAETDLREVCAVKVRVPGRDLLAAGRAEADGKRMAGPLIVEAPSLDETEGGERVQVPADHGAAGSSMEGSGVAMVGAGRVAPISGADRILRSHFRTAPRAWQERGGHRYS